MKKKQHGIKTHWYPHSQFGRLLGAPEAKPILDKLKLATGDEAAAYAERNILGALEQAFKSMRPNAGVKRGGFVLLGVDVLLDENLHAYVLESNVDPEVSCVHAHQQRLVSAVTFLVRPRLHFGNPRTHMLT